MFVFLLYLYCFLVLVFFINEIWISGFMRIAVVHDYMDTIGGGEKLALLLARGLKADLLTTNYDKGIPTLLGVTGVNIVNIGNLPSKSPFKQIKASRLFAKFDYTPYDIIIYSGNWAIFGACAGQNNYWYCHTPCREFFDLKEDIAISLPFFLRPFFYIWNNLHRRVYLDKVSFIKKIVCNSKFTRKKVIHYLTREADVVYPPIEKIVSSKAHKDYWLCISRIYPAKKIEELIDIFRELPLEKLFICGDCGKGDHSVGYMSKILRIFLIMLKYLGERTQSMLISCFWKQKAIFL